MWLILQLLATEEKVKVLVVGGTGYLGQHLLQAYDHVILISNGNGYAFDLAFTHHSSPPPHLLVNAIPSSIYFQVDLKTGVGFEAIFNTFGQVLLSPSWLNLVMLMLLFLISIGRGKKHDFD